jgi:hypothetical protein
LGWDDNTTVKYDGPPVAFSAVLKTCKQMRALAQTKGNVSEPVWFKVLLATAVHCERPDEFAHRLSNGHPGYSKEETDARIARLREGEFGPPLCTTIAAECGESGCVGCPVLKTKYKSPVTAARFHDPAAPPKVQLAAGPEIVERVLVDPPSPFIRFKDGQGIGTTIKTKKGEDLDITVLTYDLYPVGRLVDIKARTEQQMWRVHLPREAPKDFIIDAKLLYNQQSLSETLAAHGIYPRVQNLPHLRDYMVAYIAELQRLVDSEPQADRFGWDEKITRFILPEMVLHKDGTIKPVTLTRNAKAVAASLTKEGTLERQVELLKFYDNPGYMANQYLILQSLAAPLFFATNQHGIIVNATGDPGASKSSSLYTAASFWGHPEKFVVNGTATGATTRARAERITTLANLPVCMDEITTMAAKEVKEMALGVSQVNGRTRLGQDGVEKPEPDSHKATIVITTSNNSLHGSLAQDNSAGTAGSMRVFEMHFRALGIHQKHEADEYIRQLMRNYGHIGPTFMTIVMKDLDEVRAQIETAMREIDQAARIQPSERFWSADIATTVVVAEIAHKHGLSPFDPKRVREWALKVQVPHMRGVVRDEYTDNLTMLTNYLESAHAGIIVTEKENGKIWATKQPMGPLYAHCDRETNMLWVRIDAFKEYCLKRGASASKIIGELHEPINGGRIIPAPNRRRTLGAGTTHAKGQSYVFGIDLTHPSVSGVAQLVEVDTEEEAA